MKKYLKQINRASATCRKTTKGITFLSSESEDSRKLSVLENILHTYLFYLAVLGLSCSMWDLVLWPGLNLGPLHWERGVLATGTTREIPECILFIYFIWLHWVLVAAWVLKKYIPRYNVWKLPKFGKPPKPTDSRSWTNLKQNKPEEIPCWDQSK